MDPKRFSIFENTDWSASEEYALLNAIEENGYGNWEHISNRMITRTPAECQEHYNKFFIDSHFSFIPQHSKFNIIVPNIITPYRFRNKSNEEPPRYLPRTFSSGNLAGYMAARSDFEHPYDTNAEQIISHISKLYNFDHTPLIQKLACALFKVYNNRLAERHRRYNVMKTYGLLTNRKSDQFSVFAQFLSADDYDFLTHSLQRQRELRNTLMKLKAYRQKGIRSTYGIKVYHDMCQRREDLLNQLNCFEKTEPTTEKRRVKRKTSLPLNIIGLPGYERLSEIERDICVSVRLVPESYIKFKQTLIAECEKWSGLRLQDARKAIRIDVNKTRKLYDFLIEQGYIYAAK